MTSLHVKCELCGDEFVKRYFSQHKCCRKVEITPPSTEYNEPTGYHHEVEESVDGDAEMEDNGDDGRNIDDEGHGENEFNIEDISHEVFHQLFQEATFFYEDKLSNENEGSGGKEALLVQWICLFLAYWQFTFNITDTALEFIIKFFAVLLKALQETDCVLIKNMSNMFPETLYSFRNILGIGQSSYKKYVVCIKCHSLYELNDCVVEYRGEKESRRCSFVKYPNHKLKHMRKKCGQVLMKTLKSPSGDIIHFPYKTYCYSPIRKSIEMLSAREDFDADCNKWREITQTDLLTDIYDGLIWKNFVHDGHWYFENNYNLAVMLNLDWFQPFKHLSSFSIGGIYLVILNLLRSERFKRKNVILVGIIPNMVKEPPTNTFVQPLVDELNVAWADGYKIVLTKANVQIEKLYRVALLCIGCDIPASRKLCGFLGHAASRGCSKCNKLFPGQVGERDYIGFDIVTWEPRTTEEHRDQMCQLMECNTAQEKEHLESLYGTRYSVFAELPYFDTVRMTIIDPMHNLFLGTAKKMLKIWKDLDYLHKDKLELMQNRADSFIVPNDIGKIPRKIVSSFDGFTADEYKNWTLLFSLFCLKDVVPDEDLKCFQNFVLACQYLCQRIISKADVTIAHNLLLKFCNSFEKRYGQHKVTPNMHLHMHIKECVLDYGPIYGFWLFAFERYNGVLGNMPNNKKDIESQIMRRFICENSVLNIPQPLQYSGFFKPLIQRMESCNRQRGTLNDMECQDLLHVAKLSSRLCQPSTKLWYNLNFITFTKLSIECLSTNQLEYLQRTYSYMYPLLSSNAVLSPSYHKATEVNIAGELFGSLESRSVRSSYIMAFWVDAGGCIKSDSLYPRPGVIKFFLKHSFLVDGNVYEHCFAYCDWFLPVPNNIKCLFKKPVEVWYRDLFEPPGAASFIPVARIRNKFVYADFNYKSRDLMVIVPRIRHSII